MSSNFAKGFTKTSGLAGAALKGVGKVIGAVGKRTIRLGGGPIPTALTAMGAASDYGDIGNKMRQAAQR